MNCADLHYSNKKVFQKLEHHENSALLFTGLQGGLKVVFFPANGIPKHLLIKFGIVIKIRASGLPSHT
jgi:hypothetical protein